MGDIILKTHNLTKKYGDKAAVDNVNMTIEKGQIYGFIGKNGAGKTTLIRMLTGLIHKTAGEIELFGASGERELEDARVNVGSLVETPAFYENMTARENLEVSRLVRNIAGKHCIDEVLELVDLKDTGKKKVKNFSLGMKQRLGIANAILGYPSFLILDEPINALDPINIVKVREILKTLSAEKNMTILISSHILSEVAEIATHYGIINDGKLIQQMSNDELKEKCNKYIEMQVSDEKKAVVLIERELQTTDYEVFPDNIIKLYSHLDSIGRINTVLSNNGVTVNKITLQGQNLEEYFLHAVGGDK